MLWGPSGCGKTLLAAALAHEAGAQFIALSLADLLQSDVGASEQLIIDVFRRARLSAPCVVFFDEAQTLFNAESQPHVAKVRAQVVYEMDQIALHARAHLTSGNDSVVDAVIVLAATNRPDLIDHALIRGGRFGCTVNIAAPDSSERVDILTKLRETMAWSSDVDLERIALFTAGFSGADLKHLCAEAAFISFNRNSASQSPVEMQDFDRALKVACKLLD